MGKCCCCCCDESSVKKGVWTSEEDQRLIAYVNKYGHWNWRRLPKFAGLLRCGKSCRLRWMNYLRPNIRRGGFSRDEEETIIGMYATMGGRWSTMAGSMPGRTDNDIKNHWNTVLKRRVMKQHIKNKKMPTTMATKPPPAAAKISPIHEVFSSEILNISSNNESTLLIDPITTLFETVELPTAENIDIMPVDDWLSPASSIGDFWTDPLWLDSFDTLPSDYEYQAFGESNFFNFGLEEYLLQEGIY